MLSQLKLILNSARFMEMVLSAILDLCTEPNSFMCMHYFWNIRYGFMDILEAAMHSFQKVFFFVCEIILQSTNIPCIYTVHKSCDDFYFRMKKKPNSMNAIFKKTRYFALSRILNISL